MTVEKFKSHNTLNISATLRNAIDLLGLDKSNRPFLAYDIYAKFHEEIKEHNGRIAATPMKSKVWKVTRQVKPNQYSHVDVDYVKRWLSSQTYHHLGRGRYCPSNPACVPLVE